MKTSRAILSGIIVWILGIGVFTISSQINLLEDPTLQTDLVLAVFLIPLAWAGAAFYYKKGEKSNGFKLGAIMVITAIALDALFTVPLFIIPEGGSHQQFLTNLGFWVIALEYLLVVAAYWYLKIKSSLINPVNN